MHTGWPLVVSMLIPYPGGDCAYFGPGYVLVEYGMTKAGVGNSPFHSSSYEIDSSNVAGVRPVVVLKSDINKDQIQKVN